MSTAIENKFNALTHDFKFKKICVAWSEDNTRSWDWEPNIDEYEECFEDVRIELTGEDLFEYFDDEILTYFWNKHPKGLDFENDAAFDEYLYQYCVDNFDAICAYLETTGAIDRQYNNSTWGYFKDFIDKKWYEENIAD